VREFQESTLAQPIPQTFLDTVVQESLKVPARVWKAVFQAFLEADFSAELSKIKTPTLIVWGDQDALVPRSLQDILAANHRGLAARGIPRRRACLSLGRARALCSRSCGLYRKPWQLSA
jgi:pimeloyl-ACP methyl ester carboxylesterase